MTTSTKSISRVPRKPLAACCAVIFALAAPEAFAATWTVTSCADHGSGSLRDIIASPGTASGDTIDLSQLGICGSSISLTTGAIVITQKSLFLQGPTASHATVTGYYYGTRSSEPSRVFTHTGTGTLGLNYLNVSYGNLSTGTASGGCIYSKGNVVLTHSQVYACKAQSTGSGGGKGGGIYTTGNLTVKYSQISGNTLTGPSSFGGGAFAKGVFSASNSTISGNTSSVSAGGIEAYHGGSIVSSTISGNTAGSDAGGIACFIGGCQITDSTISENVAQVGYAGGVSSRSQVTVQNSTIAFNTAYYSKSGSNRYYAAGLAVINGDSPAYAMPVTLQSSIISNNTLKNVTATNGTEADFSTAAQNSGDSFTISGSGNLIRVAQGLQTPITTTACPMLGSLRNNGGLTLTHALMSHSPAIDAGNNNANLSNDQRGSPYVRVSGPPGSMDPGADIGAYEVQQNDVIFNANFEGCPVLF